MTHWGILDPKFENHHCILDGQILELDVPNPNPIPREMQSSPLHLLSLEVTQN